MVGVRVSLSLLRPANEVWGKVIFSEACVKNSVHREGVPGPGDVPGPGGGGVETPWDGYCTAAGGTHPTGMHSCFF